MRPTHIAALKQSPERVDLFVKEGADVTLPTGGPSGGYTCLHLPGIKLQDDQDTDKGRCTPAAFPPSLHLPLLVKYTHIYSCSSFSV